jgi:hypothetical protein
MTASGKVCKLIWLPSKHRQVPVDFDCSAAGESSKEGRLRGGITLWWQHSIGFGN